MRCMWVPPTVGNKGMKKKGSLWGMEKALYFLTSFAWQNLFIWDDGAAGCYVFVFVLSFSSVERRRKLLALIRV